MNCLAIDTSGTHLTVVVIKNEQVFCEFLLDSGLKHSTTLMPIIEQTLLKAGLDIKDIDVYSAVTGPGSFTGIRIGISTIKGLSYAFKKPVINVTSFDVLAYNKRERKSLAVIDALHDNFYVQGYDDTAVCLLPQFIDVKKLEQLSKEYQIISSTQIEGVNALVCDLKQGFINAVIAKMGEQNLDRESLVPLYVRKSQAEENAL